MKVICKGYKTCEFSGRCEHSRPHDFLQRQYTHINCNSVHSCQSKDANFDKCRCSSTSLRRYKLEKLTHYESYM